MRILAQKENRLITVELVSEFVKFFAIAKMNKRYYLIYSTERGGMKPSPENKSDHTVFAIGKRMILEEISAAVFCFKLSQEEALILKDYLK